jgi:hypothetical protein
MGASSEVFPHLLILCYTINDISLPIEGKAMNANRKHKASLFVTLFNTPQALRELFNTLTGSAYSEETPVEQHP